MTILITGATGLVGKELVQTLLTKKHKVHIVSRDSKRAQSVFPQSNLLKFFPWDYHKDNFPIEALQDVDKIVHLMGENIAEGRWNNEQKAEILNSRVESLKQIYKILEKNPDYKIKKLISTSAIGIYGQDKTQKFDEKSTTQQVGFLPFVCREWEKMAYKFQKFGTEISILRVGIVLSKSGGALKKMLLPFKLGMGGVLGSGQQFMSWIHIKDLVNLYIMAIEENKYGGIINAIAPQVVTNKEFTKTLSKVINRPAIIPVPSIVLKTTLGEMSEILLQGQWVTPQKAIDLKYQYEFENLEPALSNLINK